MSPVRKATRGVYKFFPARYTGIQAAYVEMLAKVDVAGVHGVIDIYSSVLEDPICSFNVSETALTRFVSADVKTDLDEDVVLTARLKLDADSDYGTLTLLNCAITVVQDDATAGIKTATSYYLCREIATTTSNNYGGNDKKAPVVYLTGNDGTVKHYFEIYLYSQTGGTAAARLYDITADAVVANSEVTTNEVDWVYCTTGEITLIDGHKYIAQLRNVTNGKIAYASAGQLLITSVGFTKVFTIPCSFGNVIEDSTNVWHDNSIRNYLGSKIVAGTKTFRYNFYVNIEFGALDAGDDIRLLNAVTGLAVGGSAINIPWTDAEYHFYRDVVITPPDTDAVFQLQDTSHHSYGVNMCNLLAFLEPSAPTYPYLPPDPTMPSGYHAFMSSFLKNVTANNKPLATPDGANRLY